MIWWLRWGITLINKNQLPKEYYYSFYSTFSESLFDDLNNVLPEDEEKKGGIYLRLMLEFMHSIDWRVTVPSKNNSEYYLRILTKLFYFIYLKREEYYKTYLNFILSDAFNSYHSNFLPFNDIKDYKEIDTDHQKYFINWLFTINTMSKENDLYYKIWDNILIKQLLTINYPEITAEDEIPFLLTVICYCCALRHLKTFDSKDLIEINDEKKRDLKKTYLTLLKLKYSFSTTFELFINTQKEFITNNSFLYVDLYLRLILSISINLDYIDININELKNSYTSYKDKFSPNDQLMIESILESNDKNCKYFQFAVNMPLDEEIKKTLTILEDILDIKFNLEKYLLDNNINRQIFNLGIKLKEYILGIRK